MVKHLLFMPDGNKRFGKERNISLDESYGLGAKSLKLFSDFFLLENNWDELTMHIMSKYTHERNDGSLKSIYDAMYREFTKLHDEQYFSKNNIQFRWIDHSNKLPKTLVELCQTIKHQSLHGNKISRNLLGYDLETDERNAFDNADNYADFVNNRLIPTIDLVIRTTEMRPSKGPVYAMSQAQMILIHKHNPELTRYDLKKALNDYNNFLDYRKTSNPLHS